MKIVIAPDSFKESLSAKEVASAIENGFRLHFPHAEYHLLPMADGGEGTLDCIVDTKQGTIETVYVKDPLGNPHNARFGILKDQTAIIEMAEASGLHLVPKEKRNPLKTSSFGSGELILAALNKGCRRFIIGLGGSATTDAGMGALNALGIQFKNIIGEILSPCGDSMSQVHSIDVSGLDPRLKESEFILAHDVDNPLLGLNGALMYAPQKGADSTQIEILHKGFEQFAHIVADVTEKNMVNIPGGGAAGGLGAGLFAFLNATFKPGALVVSETIQLAENIENASLVLTAEGKIDPQTLHGKTPIAVARIAKLKNIPVIALTANLEEGYEAIYDEGITAVFSISKGPATVAESILHTKELLMMTSYNLARLLSLRIML